MGINKATVDTIGHGTVSREQSLVKRYKRETMLKIGLRIGYYDDTTQYKDNTQYKKVGKRLSAERFSTNYKTREEFDNDRDTVFEYLLRDECAPEDLINKVAETVKELELKPGE